jgi:ribosomal protein S18 acetylase RimI-like enzyme
MSEVVVRQAGEVTGWLAEQVGRLVPQLSSTAAVPSLEQLADIASSPGSVLFLAFLSETAAGAPSTDLAGMLTLVTYRIPTGLHAVIEDVVVDENLRGGGAGSALVKAALVEATRRGARNVDLTSRPTREDANRLYTKLGFVKRETNVYRYSLTGG